ncbi:hypothetical protein [Thermomicrobium sp.]
MSSHESTREHWFAILESSARLRYGPERTTAIADELRGMADALAHLLAQPLDFDDEPPFDLLPERQVRA